MNFAKSKLFRQCCLFGAYLQKNTHINDLQLERIKELVNGFKRIFAKDKRFDSISLHSQRI